MNLRTVKWAQLDKTKSRKLLNLFICVCIALCSTVAHNITQNRPDNFPSYPSDNHHCSEPCLGQCTSFYSKAAEETAVSHFCIDRSMRYDMMFFFRL